MTLCQILVEDTYWVIYGDFLKFGGLMVLSTTTIFEKCQTTDFLIFLSSSLRKTNHSSSWLIFSYREWVVKFLGIYGLFHGAGGEVYSITFLP
jgi:hypothetical protein